MSKKDEKKRKEVICGILDGIKAEILKAKISGNIIRKIETKYFNILLANSLYIFVQKFYISVLLLF